MTAAETADLERTASEVLRRWYAAWNAHDVGAIKTLVTEDVRYEDPSAREAVLHGREALDPYLRNGFVAMPDMQLEMLEEWVSPGGAVIASAFRITGTFSGPLETPGLPPLAPTNTRIDLLGMDRSEIRGEQLARHQIFWDTTELGRQIGIMPPRGSALEKVSRHMQHFAARKMRRQASA